MNKIKTMLRSPCYNYLLTPIGSLLTYFRAAGSGLDGGRVVGPPVGRPGSCLLSPPFARPAGGGGCHWWSLLSYKNSYFYHTVLKTVNPDVFNI